MTKCLAERLHPWEVTFLRFFWGTLIMLPLMLYQRKTLLITYRPWLHLGRGTVLFIAMNLWIHGVSTAPITIATIMGFTVPIFVLLLAYALLQEPINWVTWLATLVGFVGVILVLRPQAGSFHSTALYLLLAALLFALLDIINKKYVAQEPVLCTLFCTTLVAAVLAAFPASQVWYTPTRYEFLWLLALGVSSNLALYFLLLAFAIANAASLAPFRYLQLLVAIGIDYLFFQELPENHHYLGIIFITFCTLSVGYHQHVAKK